MDVEADLGIDSIKRVEIMSELRDRFPAVGEASQQRLIELRSLEEIVGFLAGSEAVSSPKADGGTGVLSTPARLHPLPAVDVVRDVFGPAPVALVTGEPTRAMAELAERLGQNGWTILRDPDGLDAGSPLHLVLHAPPAGADMNGVIAELETALLLAGRVQRALERTARSGAERAAFCVVTELDGALGLHAASFPAAALGGLAGLVKTLAIEAPSVFARHIDLSPDLTPGEGADLLWDELHDADLESRQVGVGAQGERQTLALPDPSDPADDRDVPHVEPPGTADLLVVTGGGRGVTAACAIGLARRYQCGLLLLGRTPLEPEPGWSEGVGEEELRRVIAEQLRARGERPVPRAVEGHYRNITGSRTVRATLSAIAEAGGTAEYLPVDVTEADAVRQVLEPYRDRVTGVVHGAGVLADQLIPEKSSADIRRVLEPKLNGLATVMGALDPDRLRFVHLFSSVAGFFGNRGQADYAMANDALNGLAAALDRDLPQAVVGSLNWGAWAGGMVTPQLERLFAERGVPLIPLDQGVESFIEQYGSSRTPEVVRVVAPATDAPGLSGPTDGEIMPPASRELLVTRRLAAVERDPVLADHAIDGVPVIPATAVIGAMLRIAERTNPGFRAVGLEGFTVFRGVVLDPDAPDEVTMSIVRTEDLGLRISVRDEQGRPRYQGTVRLAARSAPSARPAPVAGLPPLDIGDGGPFDGYSDGSLFHGPRLQGIRRVLSEGPDSLLLGCRLDDVPLADGAYATASYSPVVADLLLQALGPWGRRHHGVSLLPSNVGSVEVVARAPSGEPFFIAVSGIVRQGSVFHGTVTACAADGSPYLVFRDVQLVGSAALTEKFLRSARAHLAGARPQDAQVEAQ
ncbi:SDR family NAD(P)-dependent oxidoreductase [Actinoallomurus purpureus]|nr:SDR family NAD(P)-dependent oxidoreductase [Actinoallomurus purpureus]